MQENPYEPSTVLCDDQPGSLAVSDSQNADRSTSHRLLESAVRGTASIRYAAAGLDFAGVFAVSILLAQQIPASMIWVRLTAMGISGISYYLVPEWLYGRTLGKWFLGLKVVSLDGTQCRISQIGIRTALRFIEANPILLGALPAALSTILSPLNQRIGDRIAGTTVVRASSGF